MLNDLSLCSFSGEMLLLKGGQPSSEFVGFASVSQKRIA